MIMRYYILHQGQEIGPFEIHELRKQALDEATLIREETSEQWLPAYRYKDVLHLSDDQEQVADTNYRHESDKVIKEMIMPRTWVVESIICMLCCCIPCGLVALIYALNVENNFLRGDYERSVKNSNRAKLWIYGGLIFAVITYVAALINLYQVTY